MDAYGRRPGKYGQYFVDSDSNSGESSDGDDLPLSTLRDRAVTPGEAAFTFGEGLVLNLLRIAKSVLEPGMLFGAV